MMASLMYILVPLDYLKFVYELSAILHYFTFTHDMLYCGRLLRCNVIISAKAVTSQTLVAKHGNQIKWQQIYGFSI